MKPGLPKLWFSFMRVRSNIKFLLVKVVGGLEVDFSLVKHKSKLSFVPWLLAAPSQCMWLKATISWNIQLKWNCPLLNVHFSHLRVTLELYFTSKFKELLLSSKMVLIFLTKNHLQATYKPQYNRPAFLFQPTSHLYNWAGNCQLIS